jgi:deazaflavin-dependent oxidoreductase (nitroreductase family)
MTNWNENIINEFRANAGVVGGPFEGRHLVLLTTTGNKTGRQHVTPLVALREDDRLFVFASAGGSPEDPAWYRNLVANPEVTVEEGTETYSAKAIPVTGAERDEIYARQVQVMPQFGEYQAKVDRIIPIIELIRTA